MNQKTSPIAAKRAKEPALKNLAQKEIGEDSIRIQEGREKLELEMTLAAV